MNDNVRSANAIYELLEKENMLDTQQAIDWQDQLNEISCRDRKDSK